MAGKTYTVTKRLGRTRDGALVPYESELAAFLAYKPGDEIPLEEAKEAGLIGKSAAKEADTPEDKSVAKPENKGRKTLRGTL